MNNLHNTVNSAITSIPMTDIRLFDHHTNSSMVVVFDTPILPQEEYSPFDYAACVDFVAINASRIITDRTEIEDFVTENFEHIRYALDLSCLSR